jgi:hypothetical protein
MIPGVNMKTEPFLPAVQQAGRDVDAVMNGLAPETAAGKAGKFVGSFFTPNQIALQALTGGTGTSIGFGDIPTFLPKVEGVAQPIVRGISSGINKLGSLMAPANGEALPGAAKATANLLSTLSGKGPAFGGAGVSIPELETVMTNPAAVDAAKTFPQVAEDVAGSMNKLTEHIGSLESAANATLDASKSIPVSTMTDAIEAQIKAIKMADVTTPAMENTEKVLQGMLDKIKNKGTMTQPEVAKWVKSVQGKVNWNDPLGSELNEALTHVQSAVNDALKASNPAYGAATENFSNAVNLKTDLANAMGVEKESGLNGKWTDKNVAVTKLKGLLNPDNASATKRMLGQFAQVPGVPNYLDIAKQAAAKAALGQGWRSRLAGTMAGLVPGVGKVAGNAASGGIQAIPAAGNAVYQGLTQ